RDGHHRPRPRRVGDRHRGGHPARHLGRAQRGGLRRPAPGARLHADDAGLRLPPPGRHPLPRGRGARHRRDDHLRDGTRRPLHRAGHPAGRPGGRRGRSRLRRHPRPHPAAGPAAARAADDHGGHQPAHHAVPVDGRHRRHGRRPRTRPARRPGAAEREHRPRRRGRPRRRHPRDVPRPRDGRPRRPRTGLPRPQGPGGRGLNHRATGPDPHETHPPRNLSMHTKGREVTNFRRRGAILATTTALAVTLAACGSDDGGNGSEPAATGADAGPITIGIHSGWEEGIAVSHLWQHILEEQGYEVKMETADAGVVFTGLAQGDYDVNFDTGLPATHGPYIEEYGDDIAELGVWFEEAPLTRAVNEDAPIDSLAELAENADLFDNRLVGIESGAGLTKITQEQVIPTYGLEGMDYLISSTPAMLTELSAAIDSGENVVVTLWRPHWAYDA